MSYLSSVYFMKKKAPWIVWSQNGCPMGPSRPSSKSQKMRTQTGSNWFELALLILSDNSTVVHMQICQVASGLEYLHTHWPPIAHGDIKAVSMQVISDLLVQCSSGKHICRCQFSSRFWRFWAFPYPLYH